MTEMTRATFAEHQPDGEHKFWEFGGRDRRKPGDPVRVMMGVTDGQVVVLNAETNEQVDTFSANAKFWAAPIETKTKAKESKAKSPEEHARRKLARFAEFAREYGWEVLQEPTTRDENGVKVSELLVAHPNDDQEINLTFHDGNYRPWLSFYKGRGHVFQLRNVSAARKVASNPPEWTNQCDERCQMAKSDRDGCTCECGGENHGKGRLALKAEQDKATKAGNRELVSA